MEQNRHDEIRKVLAQASEDAEQVTASWQVRDQGQEGSPQEARTAIERQGLDDDGPMIPGPYIVGTLVSVLPERHGPVWVGRWQGLNANGSAVIRHEVHGYRLYVPADGLSRIMAKAS